MDIIEYLIENAAIVLPILVLEISMKIIAIIDILKNKDLIRWNYKIMIAIVTFVTLGWGFYYLFGKVES
ncbi:hypothetical protein ACAG96_07325 [Candidatus Izemoplasma sp. B36]|uniref:hypothetical protein n=1 Tax=Candidatus Izemoplasma sp. B36 TaxID=3242468 RepID=UPI0035587E64